MSIYLNADSKIIVQGMTGGMGSKHTTLMLEAGSNIVGGVNARKAGTTVELGGKELPVFGDVKEAMEKTGADVSVLFVPPAFTKAACIEARSEEHTSELQSRENLVCRLLLEKKKEDTTETR